MKKRFNQRPKRIPAVENPLTDSELDSVRNAVGGVDKAYIDFMYHGRIRPGELLTLRHSDINGSSITLNGKTGERVIELTEFLKKAYETVKEANGTDSNFVFHKNGEEIKPIYNSMRWKKVFTKMRENKVLSREISIHDIRRKAIIDNGHPEIKGLATRHGR